MVARLSVNVFAQRVPGRFLRLFNLMPPRRRGGRGRRRGTNWQVVRESLTSFRDEISLSEHVPHIQNHHVLLELQVINQTLQRLGQAVQSVQQSVQQSEERSRIRTFNSTRNLQQAIEPILVGGAPPIGFPATSEHLLILNGADVDAILTAYSLPIIGNLAARRRRLASYLGVRL